MPRYLSSRSSITHVVHTQVAEFDPAVYRAAVIANRANQENSKLKNFVGAGNILGQAGH